MATFTLQPDFGYVVLVTIASIFVTFWMGFKVGSSRKKYEVPYPKMYSDTSEIFNCIQRAHQNTLEGYPVYLVLQIFGGWYCPKVAALCGVVWILGRIQYARGYYTGDPEKRLKGSFAYFGLLGLLGCSVMLALTLLQVV